LNGDVGHKVVKCSGAKGTTASCLRGRFTFDGCRIDAPRQPGSGPSKEDTLKTLIEAVVPILVIVGTPAILGFGSFPGGRDGDRLHSLSRVRCVSSVLVMGGRRAGRVLAANTLDAMFPVGGYLAGNREPAIKNKVGN